MSVVPATTTTTTTCRNEAGSLTLPPPSSTATRRTTADSNAHNEVANCGGNVQLMEARLCEITLSIRALVRSNHRLNEALLLGAGHDGEESSATPDPDFLQALEENKLTVWRQSKVAVALVKELQARGAPVELEDDIRTAILAVVANERSERHNDLQQGPAASDTNNNSNYTATTGAPSPSSSGIYL